LRFLDSLLTIKQLHKDFKFRATIVETFYEIANMTSVALSPKFQVVIPKDVRKALNLVAGQRLEARVVGDHVELVPELPISAIRGMCRGINTDVPDDIEGTSDIETATHADNRKA
jgi:AbrB family looped-hinge helix DNA binding protein